MPGEVIPRRNLTILGGEPVPEKSGSGRLSLADWLTRKENPLTARVIVNRIWQHHFGAGLVKTVNDFGSRGTPPSHPELLDYLASELIRSGWSMKAIHRQILLSKTYRLSSREDEKTHEIDPDNTWLSHFQRRRLSAEEIRDGILFVSGQLNQTPGKAHPFPEMKSWGFTQHNPFLAVYETDQRSVYLMVQRIKRHPFLGLFDGADPNSSTGQRFSTIVPTQALFFMNDPFVHEKADRWAARLNSVDTDVNRLSQVYGSLFGRSPSEKEKMIAEKFLSAYASDLSKTPTSKEKQQTWAAYLRVLMGSNELIFVD